MQIARLRKYNDKMLDGRLKCYIWLIDWKSNEPGLCKTVPNQKKKKYLKCSIKPNFKREK